MEARIQLQFACLFLAVDEVVRKQSSTQSLLKVRVTELRGDFLSVSPSPHTKKPQLICVSLFQSERISAEGVRQRERSREENLCCKYIFYMQYNTLVCNYTVIPQLCSGKALQYLQAKPRTNLVWFGDDFQ